VGETIQNIGSIQPFALLSIPFNKYNIFDRRNHPS